jgi:sulfur relay (sulfurtransferase) complex TusBCD TusD component (DsrE family)
MTTGVVSSLSLSLSHTHTHNAICIYMYTEATKGPQQRLNPKCLTEHVKLTMGSFIADKVEIFLCIIICYMLGIGSTNDFLNLYIYYK